MGVKKSPALFGLALTLIGACASPKLNETTPPAPEASVIQNPVIRSISEEKPACLGMVKNFCENLYAPDHQGTLAFSLRGAALQIRKGQTDNDFSQAYFEYADTQIKFKDRLPRDFRQILTQMNYFKKLSSFLSRKPRRLMNLEDRTRVLRLAYDIEALWNAGVGEVVLLRMEKKHPGYSRMREDLIPIELRHESTRVRSILISEISKAVWSEHPKWKEVEQQFHQVKEAFNYVISTHKTIPTDVKLDWLERISASRLIVPGSDPEVDMQACSRTEENAYYYTNKNYLTVCAGDFNSEDVRYTLSHELAHALDLRRSLTIFESHSPLGQKLSELRKKSCSEADFSCEQWSEFKMSFDADVAALDAFRVQLPEFHRCLKGKTTVAPIPDDYLRRVARERAQAAISGLAEKNAFLRIISKDVPALSGKREANPMYLNPCRYYLWDTITDLFDEELIGLMFFASEYRCNSELPAPDRFQRAVEKTMEMQTTLFYERIKLEGEFSPRARLVSDGYASPPTERFADALAGPVFATLLMKEADLIRRRAIYLANVAWLCQQPSIQQAMPLEAGIQRKFYVESHSEDSLRQKELLPMEVREALQCEKDFEMSECRP